MCPAWRVTVADPPRLTGWRFGLASDGDHRVACHGGSDDSDYTKVATPGRRWAPGLAACRPAAGALAAGVHPSTVTFGHPWRWPTFPAEPSTNGAGQPRSHPETHLDSGPARIGHRLRRRTYGGRSTDTPTEGW